jgi:hypothetical protein
VPTNIPKEYYALGVTEYSYEGNILASKGKMQFQFL